MDNKKTSLEKGLTVERFAMHFTAFETLVINCINQEHNIGRFYLSSDKNGRLSSCIFENNKEKTRKNYYKKLGKKLGKSRKLEAKTRSYLMTFLLFPTCLPE